MKDLVHSCGEIRCRVKYVQELAEVLTNSRIIVFIALFHPSHKLSLVDLTKVIQIGSSIVPY